MFKINNIIRKNVAQNIIVLQFAGYVSAMSLQAVLKILYYFLSILYTRIIRYEKFQNIIILYQLIIL